MHSASQTVQICTSISISSICGNVGTYEQEGSVGEGYNDIVGDCERDNAVIEDIFGTGDLLSLDFRYTYLRDEGIDTRDSAMYNYYNAVTFI